MFEGVREEPVPPPPDRVERVEVEVAVGSLAVAPGDELSSEPATDLMGVTVCVVTGAFTGAEKVGILAMPVGLGVQKLLVTPQK